MSSHHTLKSYDKELVELRSLVSEMAGYAQAQLSASVAALVDRNADASRQIAQADDKLDELDRRIERFAVEIIARRSPVADDLREIIAALKIASALERMGDYAKNIAKRTLVLSANDPVPALSLVPQMAEEAAKMIHNVIEAFINVDAEAAVEVWQYDARLDNLYNGMFRELLNYMTDNPQQITACTHLIFCAKNIERVGDQATNIAELVYFAIVGETMAASRPTEDNTAYQDVEPESDQ